MLNSIIQQQDDYINGIAMRLRKESHIDADLSRVPEWKKDAYIEHLEQRLATKLAESTGYGTHNPSER